MTTPATTGKLEKEAVSPPSSRTRSPGYPAFSLQTSLERARAVWEHEKRNPASTTALAAAWGLNVKSSSTLLSVSSLKKFGLLEDVDGGKERLLKLSQSALNIILNDQEDSAERIGLLKQCALTPQIHAELWKQYNGDLPSDTSLKRHLIVEKNFNAASVDGFIKQFKDTISFAKLAPSDKITITETEDSETEQMVRTVQNQELKIPGLGQPKPVTVVDAMAKMAGFSGFSGSPGTMAVLREFTFPLPAGMATLKVPFPLREVDFDALIKTLQVFKDGMVKTEITAIDCNGDDWNKQAAILAESKMEFDLVNFDFSFHSTEARNIAIQNNFNFRFNPNNGTANFRIRPEPEKK